MLVNVSVKLMNILYENKAAFPVEEILHKERNINLWKLFFFEKLEVILFVSDSQTRNSNGIKWSVSTVMWTKLKTLWRVSQTGSCPLPWDSSSSKGTHHRSESSSLWREAPLDWRFHAAVHTINGRFLISVLCCNPKVRHTLQKLKDFLIKCFKGFYQWKIIDHERVIRSISEKYQHGWSWVRRVQKPFWGPATAHKGSSIHIYVSSLRKCQPSNVLKNEKIEYLRDFCGGQGRPVDPRQFNRNWRTSWQQ